MNKIITDPNLVFQSLLYKHDGSTFMDDSAYGHLCTVTGATWGIQGRTFGGVSDYIITDFNQTDSSFSLFVWVKPLASQADGRLAFELFYGGFMLMNLELQCQIYDGLYRTLLQGSLSLNTWHFVAMTYNGSQLYSFIDGEITGNPTIASALTPSTNVWHIGAYETGQQPLNGIIGEAGIYNRTLTPIEIQCNYLATKWRYR